MKRPTAAQWREARMIAAMPHWQRPAEHDLAHKIEAGWHDGSPAVQRALSDVTGKPLPIPPMPGDPGDSRASRIVRAVLIAALILAGSVLLFAVIQILRLI